MVGGGQARIRAGRQKFQDQTRGEETGTEQRQRLLVDTGAAPAGKGMEVGKGMRKAVSKGAWQKQIMSPAPQAEMDPGGGDLQCQSPAMWGFFHQLNNCFHIPSFPSIPHTDTCPRMHTRTLAHTYTPTFLSLRQETIHLTNDSIPSPRDLHFFYP